MNFVINPRFAIKKQVYEEIKNCILSFVFIPGQGLSEKEIALRLNVSRTPVREAFIQLAQEGIVEIFPQRGTFVSLINESDVIQSQFIRKTLEVEVVKRVAEIRDEQTLTKLYEIIEEQMKAKAAQNFELFYKKDDEFHQQIIYSSGYPKVWETIQMVGPQMNRLRFLSIPADSQMERIIEQHKKIVEAIAKKDEQESQNLMFLHLEGVPQMMEILSQEYSAYFST
jgi:DNA-binding GntR family transcriptional regulator